MKKGDTQLGTPMVPYKDTKTNIEALTGVVTGAIAFATDTGKIGTYGGATWTWYGTGSGGGSSAYDPDNPPVSPNAMDDEFEGGSLDAKWTEVKSSGTASTYVITGTKLVISTPASNTKRHHDFLQTAPVGTWKMRAKFAFEGLVYRYVSLGLGVYDNTSGRTLSFNLMAHDAYGFFSGVRVLMNGETAINETDLRDFRSQIFYMELEKTNSTTVQARISTTGHEGTFMDMTTAQTLAGSGMTAFDKVGITGHAWVNESDWSAKTSCDWFRRIS